MRPRLIACFPRTLRRWIGRRYPYGVADQSNTLLFYAFKLCLPGDPGETDRLLRRILNPPVCTRASKAQIALTRWREDVRHLMALDSLPPDPIMSFLALESIFGTVFEKAEPTLCTRRSQLKNRLGLPYLIAHQA